MRALTNWFGKSALSTLGKLALQLHRSGRGIDLVVDGEQVPGGQHLREAAAGVGVHRQMRIGPSSPCHDRRDAVLREW